MRDTMGSLVAPDGYGRHKCTREGVRGAVYSAVRERDGVEVVLKAYDGGRGRAADEARARREFEALRAVAGPGVPAALELLTGHSPPRIVVERVPGIALDAWCRSLPCVEPRSFVEVALQLTGVLARAHAKDLIHGEVVPGAVRVDPATLQTHLVDFGSARRLGSASEGRDVGAAAADRASGLRYMAPE